MDKIEKLRQQEQQIKAKIQKELAKLNTKERKERTGRLVSLGVLVEQMIQDPEDPLTAETVIQLCKRYLKDRTLERALTGPLAETQAPAPEPEPVGV